MTMGMSVQCTLCALLCMFAPLALGGNSVVEGGQSSGPGAVALGWGIADTTATVGQRFAYHIPGDAFTGKVASLEVVEVGKETLPPWLELDRGRQLLLGVAGPADTGKLYLEARAWGQDGSMAKDTFTVTVSIESPPAHPLRFQPGEPQTVWCGKDEPETLVTVAVDADWDRLTGGARLQLLQRATAHLNLSKDALKLMPRGAEPLFDVATDLVSGKGEQEVATHPGCLARWRVGCGRVEGHHMTALTVLERDATTGALGRVLGHPVLAWRVTNTRFQQHKRRRRQAVRATPTPAITPTLPTRPPTQQTTVAGGATEGGDTMTRAVPSMASPTFDIRPTQTLPPMTRTDTPEATRLPPTRPTGPGEVQPSAALPDPTGPGRTEILPTKTMVVTTEPPTKEMPTKPPRTTRPPEKTTPRTPEKTTPRPPVCMPQMPPEVDTPLPTLEFTAGEVVRYRIPDSLFKTCMGDNTKDLNLSALDKDSSPLGESFWLQFDSKRQIFHGLPLATDVGTYTINLVAVKPKMGNPATYEVMVKVIDDQNAKSGLINHEMSMKLDMDFKEFKADTENAITLANKISRLYGERHGKSLTITGLKAGSVLFSWTNNTLASSGCPVDEIKQMFDKLVKEDGTLTEEAKDTLSQFKVVSAKGEPQGACVGNPNFPLRPAPGKGQEPEAVPEGASTPGKPVASSDMPSSTTEATAKGSAGGEGGDIWITTVVPAVVIVVILLIALVIACVLYRKKRKGKMNLEDQNTFVNKGVPVIFADELDEKPTDSSKPLLLEGAPPAPPPGYQRGSSESPKTNHQKYNGLEDAHEMENIEETDVTSPLYAPPPPVTASSGNKQRPHVQPSYRTQPPSIPP